MINQRKNKRQPEENDHNEPYTRQGNIQVKCFFFNIPTLKSI